MTERGELLTPANAAQTAGVCRTRINELINRGKIASVRIDGRRFVVRQSLLVWIRARSTYNRRGREAA